MFHHSSDSKVCPTYCFYIVEYSVLPLCFYESNIKTSFMRKKCAQGQRNEFCDILPWAQCTSSNCYHCIQHAESWINFSLHFTFCLIPPCLLHWKILPFPLNATFPSILLARIDPCDDCYFVNFRRNQRQKELFLWLPHSWVLGSYRALHHPQKEGQRRTEEQQHVEQPSEPQPRLGAMVQQPALKLGSCWKQQG